jgi:hypothetical protein
MSEEEDDDSRISNNSPRPPEMKFNPAMIDPEMISKLKQVRCQQKIYGHILSSLILVYPQIHVCIST